MSYYSEDGSIFTSKIKAEEYRIKTNQAIKFWYYDHIYEKLNWSIEPEKSLDFYYKEQAQRLRDKYEYLILCYSGGYDSTNILEAFVFNNIKIDKIVIVGTFSQDSFSGSDEHYNGELYKNAFSYIKELDLGATTEIYDPTTGYDAIDKNFSVLQYGNDWIDQMGGWFDPTMWHWRDIEKQIIPSNIGSKKVGIIFGKDKPTLYDSKFSFTDAVLTCYGNVQNTENASRINFYWDHEYPEILLKQLHILKKIQDAGAVISFNSAEGAQNFSGVSTNKILYKLKKPLLFKSPKSNSMIFTPRLKHILENKNSDVYKRYMLGIEQVEKRIGLKNIKPISSQLYGI